MHNKSLLIPFLIGAITCYAQEESSKTIIDTEAEYIGEVYSNLRGGIQPGTSYLGLIYFGLGLQSEKLGLWKGTSLNASIQNTHGSTPSADMVGDLQVASNIENGNNTNLYELWVSQQIGEAEIKAGIMDLNAECHAIENSCIFLNSSFGIIPTVSLNMPSPIFPMPALGIVAKVQLHDRYLLQAGLWDGEPGDYENNQYNTHWSLGADEGLLAEAELTYQMSRDDESAGFIRGGIVHHTGEFQDLIDSTLSIKGKTAFHLLAEKQLSSLIPSGRGQLNGFIQIGYVADEKTSISPFYLGAGFNIAGLLPRKDDVLGLAVAYASISSRMTQAEIPMSKNETAVELTYQFPITNNFCIQPDFQYLINTGANPELDNSMVFLIRFTISN